jgi:hypothetical protein
METPTVCSLPSDQLSDRLAMIRREILPHATRRQVLADGVAVEFAHTAEMEKTLEDLVAFERKCCSGLTWSLTRPSADVLRLSVEGLGPDSDLFGPLAACGERC